MLQEATFADGMSVTIHDANSIKVLYRSLDCRFLRHALADNCSLVNSHIKLVGFTNHVLIDGSWLVALSANSLSCTILGEHIAQ